MHEWASDSGGSCRLLCLQLDSSTFLELHTRMEHVEFFVLNGLTKKSSKECHVVFVYRYIGVIFFVVTKNTMM